MEKFIAFYVNAIMGFVLGMVVKNIYPDYTLLASAVVAGLFFLYYALWGRLNLRATQMAILFAATVFAGEVIAIQIMP